MIPNEISIRLVSLVVSLPSLLHSFPRSLVPLPGSAVDCPIAILAWDVVVVVHLDHLWHPASAANDHESANPYQLEAFSLYVGQLCLKWFTGCICITAWLAAIFSPKICSKTRFRVLPTSRIARSCVGPAPGGTSKPNSRMRRISPASAF